MKPAIEVHHVTKEYRLGAMQSLRQLATTAGARLLGRAAAGPPPFKALDDVSFSIQPGEVVGVIGHNGAGKSTLLKILSRIVTPTTGHVRVNGRVAPLIEVGAGFVGEMTGRENVYLNGAILGMSRKEIARKFDEIVDFAEMSQFIDTPVKRYSSGMQVKLAFAVATSIESEILIVDEVLAVGDLAFQRKCFDRMEALIKRERRTVLLVSHNIRQVERLCTRAILLDRGRLVADGDTRQVCNSYYEANDARIKLDASRALVGQAKVAGTGDVDVKDVAFISDAGETVDRIVEGQSCVLRIRFEAHRQLRSPIFGVGVHTVDFLYLSTAISEEQFASETLGTGIHVVMFSIRSFPFLPGVYCIRLGINEGELTSNIFYGESMVTFQVAAARDHRTQAMQEGFVEMHGQWQLEPERSLATSAAEVAVAEGPAS